MNKKYLLGGLLVMLAVTVMAGNYLKNDPVITINDNENKAVIVKLNETNFIAETTEGVVVVDFYADWCGPCRQLAPILESLTDVKVGKVDVEAEQKLAKQFNVNGIPLLVFMKNGEEQSRMVGVQPKDKIQEVIDNLKD